MSDLRVNWHILPHRSRGLCTEEQPNLALAVLSAITLAAIRDQFVA